MESNSMTNECLLDTLEKLAILSDDADLDLSSSGRKFATAILAHKREILSRTKAGHSNDDLNTKLTSLMTLAVRANQERTEVSFKDYNALKQEILGMVFEPELQSLATSAA